MTRGRIYLFDVKGNCYETGQFLSDMYPELPHGHGCHIIAAFLRRQLRNRDDLKKYTINAYENWFDHYIDEDEEILTEIEGPAKVVISGIMDDYSYILNCSGKEKRISVGDADLVIDKDEMIVLNFSQTVMRIHRDRGKTSVELIDTEIYTCIDALDTYNRLFIGQYDIIDSNLRMRTDLDERFYAEDNTRCRLYEAMRSRVFKDSSIANYDFRASLGIWSDETDDRAKCSYDIQQVMRYKDAYCRHPEGGNTVDFRDPMIKGKLPEIGCECRLKEESVIETIIITSGHARILDDALYVNSLLNRYSIRRAFEYYTKDPIVLEIAGILNKLYSGFKINAELQRIIDCVREKIIFAGAVTVKTE